MRETYISIVKLAYCTRFSVSCSCLVWYKTLPTNISESNNGPKSTIAQILTVTSSTVPCPIIWLPYPTQTTVTHWARGPDGAASAATTARRRSGRDGRTATASCKWSAELSILGYRNHRFGDLTRKHRLDCSHNNFNIGRLWNTKMPCCAEHGRLIDMVQGSFTQCQLRSLAHFNYSRPICLSYLLPLNHKVTRLPNLECDRNSSAIG